VIERAPEHRTHPSQMRAADKTLTFRARDGHLLAWFLLTLYMWMSIIPIE